jgi:putative transposase
VTTDGHRSYPRALGETIGNHVRHRTSTYLNNRLEQDHRGIRTALLSHAWMREPLKRRLVSVVTRDELQKYFRPRRIMGEAVSLSQRRPAFLDRLVALQALLQAAS